MKFLKCIVSGSESSFVKGKIYPVTSKGNYNVYLRCDSYRVTSENGRVIDVPLEGAVWGFVLLDISLEQMYFNYSKNKEVVAPLIQAGIAAGYKSWASAQEYTALINPSLEHKHAIFFDEREGMNGVDSGNVQMHKPNTDLFEVSGADFLAAFLDKVGVDQDSITSVAKEDKPRVPRVRRKRKAPPKKTTTAATLRYKNGDSFTFRSVKNVSLVDGILSIITEKKVEEGISQRVLNKIDSKLVRSVMLESPKGVEEVYQDYFLDGQWMVYAQDRTIMNSKMFELRF